MQTDNNFDQVFYFDVCDCTYKTSGVYLELK